MAYYTESELRGGTTASAQTYSQVRDTLRKEAKRAGPFDVFLSHAKLDEIIIYRLKQEIEASGVSVYVDWLDDPQLDRSRVTSATASAIRARMRECQSLIYATSPAASQSKWMPWELGFFDGLRGPAHIGVMPVVKYSSDTYVGLEYLGLYDTVEKILTKSGSHRPFATRLRGMEVKSMRDLAKGSTTYQRIG